MPLLLYTTVPFSGCSKLVTAKVLPCGSVSLPNTSTVTGVSCGVVSWSLLAITLLSGNGSMVIVTTASSQACGVPSSQIVYTNTSVPVYPGSGV